MGRTPALFAVLIAVGGCVSDDSGPLAQYPTTRPDQTVQPGYASWSRRPDQFAAMQDPTAQPPAHATSAAPAAAKPSVAATTPPATAMKPAVASPAVTKLPPPDPTPVSSDVVVDSALVNATMVTSTGDKPESDLIKKATAPAHSGIDVEQAVNDPAAPAIRMVNSKRITLNYELKDVGSSGVSGVELWVTQASQEAHVWKRGEIVAQSSHSFTVEVKDEGLYGFTLLARNGSGVGKDAPAAGEPPQVWVMVDVTKPAVQISSVEINRSTKEPTVEIHWTAKDKNLGPKPITLSFAEQPEGPWTPIAAGVENSGQYEWTPPATAPHRLYLRVEAVDMPGNTASAQTANPLRLDAEAAVIAPPPADATHKTLPAPPALDTSHPSAAIMAVEPSAN
ncbi:MAG TPA: hypothetical protein VMS17_03535 [Gemmataceae bacterium]|nr:hypothetical protein [Gemmataceae bacterium]